MFFKKGPFTKTKRKVEKLFKDSRISKEEKEVFLSRIADAKYIKNIKIGNSSKWKHKLEEINNDLDKENVEKINLQNETNTEKTKVFKKDVFPKEIPAKDLIASKKATDESQVTVTNVEKDELEISDYEKIKNLSDELEKIIGKEKISGFNKNEIQKSIGNPEYLNTIKNKKDFEKASDEIIEKSNEHNFHDIALYFKERDETDKVSKVLGKHLHNASRIKMIDVVSDIYPGDKNRINTIVANIYLNKGDYISAREVLPKGKLAQTCLKKCADIARSKRQYKIAIYCYGELEKENLIKDCLLLLIKKTNIIETESFVAKNIFTKEAFKKSLSEIITNIEHPSSKKIIPIKNIFKKNSDYKACAELMVRKLFQLGDYSQGIEILDLQKVTLTDDLIEFMCSEMSNQLSEAKEIKEGSILIFSKLLKEKGKESIIFSHEDNIKNHYYKKGSEEEFMSFNKFLWETNTKIQKVAESAA